MYYIFANFLKSSSFTHRVEISSFVDCLVKSVSARWTNNEKRIPDSFAKMRRRRRWWSAEGREKKEGGEGGGGFSFDDLVKRQREDRERESEKIWRMLLNLKVHRVKDWSSTIEHAMHSCQIRVGNESRLQLDIQRLKCDAHNRLHYMDYLYFFSVFLWHF